MICRKLIVLLILLTSLTQLSAQQEFDIAEIDIDPNDLVPGYLVRKSGETLRLPLCYHRPSQRLYINTANGLTYLTASDAEGFEYTDPDTDERKRFVSIKFQRSWPSYERMTFFQVIAEFSNCAVLAADRPPQITDRDPSPENFMAGITQGRRYHILLPDGRIVPYEQEQMDVYYRLILESSYQDVMAYADMNHLNPRTFGDMLTILNYALN